MAESPAGTWASLAGVEIVNDARTFAYLRAGLGPGSITLYGDCGTCNIIDLLDCPEVTGYESPAIDGAPWYSEDIPESADFLGFITDEFTGMGSTFTRDVKEALGNGGVLTRSRLGTRELTWRGYLFGATCCSVQYGLRWLSKALARFDTTCRDCFGDDLELLVCCPEEGSPTSPFRLLKGVGLLEGPTIESERATCSSRCGNGCGGSCIIEVEFTLVSTQPYFYAPPVPVYDCINIYENQQGPLTQATVECGPGDCSDILFEEGSGICPAPDLPPTATYQNECLNDFVVPVATYLTVSRNLWNDLEEVVPVISITTGTLPIGRIDLGFYISPNGNPCGDLSTYPPECDVLCHELSIIAIPADSTFYIDGRTRKMAVVCPNGTAFPGERLTSGPWSWPSFDCYGFCLEVRFEGLPPQASAQNTCISLSLVPRTF